MKLLIHTGTYLECHFSIVDDNGNVSEKEISKFHLEALSESDFKAAFDAVNNTIVTFKKKHDCVDWATVQRQLETKKENPTSSKKKK